MSELNLAPRGSELERRLGGAVGAHAVRRGIWFDPVPWAVLASLGTWLVLLWHQHTCVQTTAGHPVNTLMRLCYSDIPLVYQGTGFATGLTPYRGFGLDYGTVTAALMVVARWITELFGFPSRPGLSQQRILDASNAWWLATAVLLYLAFLALVGVHLLLGRGSARDVDGRLTRRVRSWDALYVAGAPVVAAAGLVNWDLLAAALVGLGLLAWALRRPMLAGALLGLATASKFYPIVILLGILVLCVRAGLQRAPMRALIGFLAAWLVANVPVLLVAPRAWLQWYTGWLANGADLGSIWWLLQDAGLRVPYPGAVGALLWLSTAGFVLRRALAAPRRPRVGQVAFLLVAAVVLLDKGYPPQHVLWVLPLLVLARPVLTDWAVFTIAELLYFWAVWGHLNGSTVSGGQRDLWYWCAILLRVAVVVWISTRVLRDMQRPWDDPVRGPLVDDPVGGVLDHAPDAVVLDSREPVDEGEDAPAGRDAPVG
ncbi:MAG TPA: glycosyltransferase 87 family protein [Propionibacteriaceae bacterium]|nr:glycosyltransferase 87 family protein [Propionibacteriaceae bacterium]